MKHPTPPWRARLGSLTALNDAPWRWGAGAVAGLATGLPLGIATLMGYSSHGLVAALGSFTALFFADMKFSERARVMPLVAVGVVVAALVGVLFASSKALTVLGVMLVAALACLLALGLRVGPPGPMPFIVVNGVSAYLSTPVELGGPGLAGPAVLAMVAAGALSSWLVVAFPLLLPRVRRREGPARSVRKLIGRLEFDPEGRRVALRVLAAVLVASVVSLFLEIPRGHWVVLTAVAILQASHRVTLTVARAAQRFLGTLAGLTLFAPLALLRPGGAWLVAIVSALELMVEVVIARNYGLALVFITPLALTISSANTPGSALEVVGQRVRDTFMGAVIALLVLFAGEWLRRRARRAG